MSATMMSALTIGDESIDEAIPVYEEPEITPDQQAIAKLAYALWEARGCPDGSPEEDWFRAEAELKAGMSLADR